MPHYCEVALSVPLDKLFYYSVPASLSLRPGMRVIVPFGNRKLLGVVVHSGVTPVGIDEASIKAVQEAVDVEAALSGELLKLGKWIAEYYLAPEGEVLIGMFPPNASVRSKTRVVLTAEGKSSLLDPSIKPGALSPVEHALLQRIGKRGGIRRETLRDHAALVQKLQRKGLVAVEREMEGRAAKTNGSEEHTDLAREPGDTAETPAARHELNAQQTAVLARIQQKMAAGKFGVVLLHGV